MAARTRYERLDRHPGITRVHSQACAWLVGRRCNCRVAYRAEAFDKAAGRRRYATRDTLVAAERWRQDERNAIREGKPHGLVQPTLAQGWAVYHDGIRDGTILAKGGTAFKPGVVRAYEAKFRNYLIPRWGSKPVDELRLKHVQELVDELVGAGKQPQTVRNTVMPLRAFYRWCIRREFVAVNPCDNVELPSGEESRDRVVAVPVALAMIDAVPDAADRAVWATAFLAGLRRGELMALDWAEVDLAARVLRVVRSYDPGAQQFVTPKSKKGTREVGLPKLLLPYLAALDRTEGLVFGKDGKRPFNAPGLQERADAVWSDRVTLHECRHTYASLMIDARKINIKTISEWMGHASVQITLDRYGHLLPGSRMSVLDDFDDYLETNQ
jgi:integrase